VALHRLGIPVRLGTFLGTGQFSLLAQKKLKEYGVNYINMYKGNEPEPLIITSVISTGGDRSFVSYQPEHQYGSGPGSFYATEGQVYELYKGSRIAYVTLGYDDVWKRLKRRVPSLSWTQPGKTACILTGIKNVFPYIDYFTPERKGSPEAYRYEFPGRSARRPG
jgi:hypothetical protein